MDMLLGLDMLKRHQCCIDLKRNVLKFGSNGTETPFLPEAELPECARLSSAAQSMEDAIKASAKDAEDRQLKEALAKSEQDSKRMKGDTSSSSSAAAGASSSIEIRPDDKFTEADVTALMKYGFPRDKCVEELRAHGGDMKTATAALFAKSLKF